MQLPDALAAEDLKAGRLLEQMTVDQLAQACGVSHDTIQRMEAGRGVCAESKGAVVRTLEGRGIRFDAPGYVFRADGPMAPCRLAVGIFHGDRIRKARWRLAWTQEHLAGLAKTTVRVLREMEAGRNLNATPSLVFYRALGELQLAGMVFAPTRHGGRRGDYCLVPRPIRSQGSRPLRDHAVATVTRPKGPPMDVAAWVDCVDELVCGQGVGPKIEWPKDLEQQARIRGMTLRQARERKSRGDD